MAEPNEERQAPVPAAGAPETQTVDYESKYRGVDRVLQQRLKELNEKTGQIEALNTQTSTYKTQLEELSRAKAELEQKVAAEAKAREEVASKAATLEKELFQSKTLGQFPELRPYAEKGILRTDLTGEDFVKYAQEFRQTLADQTKASAEQMLRGSIPSATPSAPAAGGAVNEETLREQHQAAMDRRDWPQADLILKQLFALQQQKP